MKSRSSASFIVQFNDKAELPLEKRKEKRKEGRHSSCLEGSMANDRKIKRKTYSVSLEENSGDVIELNAVRKTF